MLRAGQHEYVIHGMHPEVCFWALNGNKPMAYSKRTDEGFIERMAISRQYFASSQQVIDDAKRDHRRTDLARDDIVDALVGTVCARNYPALSQFPNHTEIDDEGLPMEIMYRQP